MISGHSTTVDAIVALSFPWSTVCTVLHHTVRYNTVPGGRDDINILSIDNAKMGWTGDGSAASHPSPRKWLDAVQGIMEQWSAGPHAPCCPGMVSLCDPSSYCDGWLPACIKIEANATTHTTSTAGNHSQPYHADATYYSGTVLRILRSFSATLFDQAKGCQPPDLCQSSSLWNLSSMAITSLVSRPVDAV